MKVADYAVDPVGVVVECIVAAFEVDVEEKEETTGHAYCQAGNVDEGVGFFAPEVAEGDGEVVF